MGDSYWPPSVVLVMIFDLEADGLLDEATKIHVFAYKNGSGIEYTYDYEEIRRVLSEAKLLIGHNIIAYDIPLLEKILRIKIECRVIDTLPLSWYLNHSRVRHGLEGYGEEFGVQKPEISDWENLTPEEYAHRCVEDVRINSRLWNQLKSKLLKLYPTKKEADRLLNYLTFKMECVREQERSSWKLDKALTERTLETLYTAKEEKTEALSRVMPSVKKYVNKNRPSKPFKADGSYSVVGAKWFKLLRDRGLPENYTGSVKVLHREEEPNPGSHSQIKSWLVDLGWVPESFKYDKDKDGNERKIPQVRVDGKEGKELCPSVKRLIEDYPEVELLDGLSVIDHRISIFEGFLKNEKDGWLKATVGGLTNTLRFKHRVLVNLPGVHRPWGQEIRGSLIAPEGYELCGSDVCSLEENTKKHYIYPYDPSYVKEMSKEGFDAHLDLAKHAGVATQKEIDCYGSKEQWALDKLKPVRQLYKIANYSCIYGIGAAKLSRNLGITKKEAQALIDAYWKRNWAVKKLCEDVEIKTVDGEMWLFNPVSRFWYSLRFEKDIFSTLNQGTGVYCFDRWIREFRKVRPQLTAQFHDEIINCLKKGNRDRNTKMLKEAMVVVNKQLGLNVQLDVDVQYGDTYADVH